MRHKLIAFCPTEGMQMAMNKALVLFIEHMCKACYNLPC